MQSDNFGRLPNVVFGRISKVADLADAYAPHSRAVIVWGASDEKTAERIRVLLSARTPVCVRLEKNAVFSLFGAEDDIRLAVGVGECGILAARYFSAVRGCPCIAVPCTPSARECFCKTAESEFGAFPLPYPTAVSADGDEMHGFADAFAETAMSELCAEELRINDLFARRVGGTEKFPTENWKEYSDRSADREKLFRADMRFRLALRDLPQFACIRVLDAEKRKSTSDSGVAFAVLHRFSVETEVLFVRGSVRRYYVTDYTGRALAAARYARIPFSDTVKNVCIPTIEEDGARRELFAQCRKKSGISARLLCEKVSEISAVYFSAGGRDLRGDRTRFYEAFCRSAELSPLYSAAALARDFGLLPPPFANGEEKDAYVRAYSRTAI